MTNKFNDDNIKDKVRCLQYIFVFHMWLYIYIYIFKYKPPAAVCMMSKQAPNNFLSM